jgi:RNA polymerase sigma-32 factor
MREDPQIVRRFCEYLQRLRAIDGLIAPISIPAATRSVSVCCQPRCRISIHGIGSDRVGAEIARALDGHSRRRLASAVHQAPSMTIRQYAIPPLLTPSEEQDLLRRYQETRDPKIEARLVGAHMRLVIKIARDFSASAQDLPDLIQEGNLGLVRAVRKFDPARGVKLSVYAAWWIRAYQLRFLVENHRLVKIGTTAAQRKLFFKLRETERHLGRDGRPASAGELAAALGVDEHEVVQMRERLGARDLSLDSPFKSEGRQTLLDRLPADHRPDLMQEEAEIDGIVRREASRFHRSLSGRERALFDARWQNDDQSSLEQVGRQFGVSRERARQIERRMLDRLRDQLAEKLGTSLAS